MSTPFPEDNTDTLETYWCDRFMVYWISKYEHVICDNARLSDRLNGMQIKSYLLENRAF